MNIKKCRYCGAPIIWIPTPGGKSMPCEVDEVRYQAKPGGKQRIVTKNGEVIACEITPDGMTGIGYVPHWGNCPGAKEDTTS